MKMNYEELIHEFMEGTLDSAAEERLFDAMASSDEVRADFRQQFAMRSAIKSDVKAFTPKAESTLNIFSQLGFAPPAPVPVPFGQRVLQFIGSHSNAILTGLISAAASALVVFLLMDSGNANINANNANNKIPVVESTAPVNDDVQSGNNSIVNGQALADATEDNKSPEKEIVYVDRIIFKNAAETTNREAKLPSGGEADDSENANSHSSNDKFTENAKIDAPAFGMINNENPSLGFNPSGLPEKGVLPDNYISGDFDISFLEQLGISAEISNAQAFFRDEENIMPQESREFNNWNIGLYFEPEIDLAGRLKAGFEYRRENYYLVFNGMEDGTAYRYELQPNLATWSFNARWNPGALEFWKVSPFIQSSAGFNDAGQVWRNGIGAEINLSNDFKLILGAEYGNLWYKYGGNWFTSGKYGLFFGTGIRLF
jgi:hypothetical protein